jgi:hypothetical protein
MSSSTGESTRWIKGFWGPTTKANLPKITHPRREKNCCSAEVKRDESSQHLVGEEAKKGTLLERKTTESSRGKGYDQMPGI